MTERAVTKMAYLTAIDGKRIFVDPDTAQRFRSVRLHKINAKQYGNRKIGGSLARAIMRRHQRLRRTDIVVALRGERDLRGGSLVVLPANSTILRGSGITRTREGTFRATIWHRYQTLWTKAYPTLAGAQRERTKALKRLGFL